MMIIFGIFLLSFLWLRNTTMTVKFAMLPTEATELIRILSSLALSLLELSDVENTVAEDTDALLNGNLFDLVPIAIVR